MSRRKRHPGPRIVYFRRPFFTRPTSSDKNVKEGNIRAVAEVGKTMATHGRAGVERLPAEIQPKVMAQGELWPQRDCTPEDDSHLRYDREKMATGAGAVELVRKYGWRRAEEILKARKKAGRKETE